MKSIKIEYHYARIVFTILSQQELVDLKTGRAKDVQAKKRMIETYNTIYMTSYKPTTNCGSCISTCYDGIKKLYYEYSKDYRKDD